MLVVDDNRDAADSLALLLVSDGHTVEVAYGPDDALNSVDRVQPDVVLLDIGMPGLDGHDVARILRARHGDDLLLIALTGYGQAQDRERSRNAGFNAHLVKPTDLQTLRRSIDGRSPDGSNSLSAEQD